MSGHSKWSSIKHKKAAQDAKRGKIFTKLIREITVAARAGGGDPGGNPRLRAAIQTARGQNMPMDTINRAVSKGAGGTDGDSYEEVIYEGFGPGNVAVVIRTLTDNRNRTIAAIRTAFNKFNGTLAAANAVQHMFDRKGVLVIPRSAVDEETLTEWILEAGAEDLEVGEEEYLVTCSVEEFEEVKAALEARELALESAELALLPTMRVEIGNREEAEKVLNFLDMLEDEDDVQQVFSNFDIPPEILAELA